MVRGGRALETGGASEGARQTTLRAASFEYPQAPASTGRVASRDEPIDGGSRATWRRGEGSVSRSDLGRGPQGGEPAPPAEPSAGEGAVSGHGYFARVAESYDRLQPILAGPSYEAGLAF